MVDEGRHSSQRPQPARAGLTQEDFRRLYPKVAAVLRKAGVSHEEVRDLTQTVLLAAHKSFPSFEGRSDVDTWVVSIAKNLLLQHRRNRERLKRAAKEVTLDDSLSMKSFEDDVITRDLVKRAYRAIRRLPDELQQPLVLMARGFKYHEIARILNISENRVSSLIYQARKKLRLELRGDKVDSGYRSHV